MINTSEFIIRLEKIIRHYGLSASSFSEKIGVQRSSISHILSGRNKPSLEFVMKILSSFPEIDLYWLLNGKGSFPIKEVIIDNKNKNQKSNQIKTSRHTNSVKTIKRIVIFYSDGSFESFDSENAIE